MSILNILRTAAQSGPSPYFIPTGINPDPAAQEQLRRALMGGEAMPYEGNAVSRVPIDDYMQNLGPQSQLTDFSQPAGMKPISVDESATFDPNMRDMAPSTPAITPHGDVIQAMIDKRDALQRQLMQEKAPVMGTGGGRPGAEMLAAVAAMIANIFERGAGSRGYAAYRQGRQNQAATQFQNDTNAYNQRQRLGAAELGNADRDIQREYGRYNAESEAAAKMAQSEKDFQEALAIEQVKQAGQSERNTQKLDTQTEMGLLKQLNQYKGNPAMRAVIAQRLRQGMPEFYGNMSEEAMMSIASPTAGESLDGEKALTEAATRQAKIDNLISQKKVLEARAEKDMAATAYQKMMTEFTPQWKETDFNQRQQRIDNSLKAINNAFYLGQQRINNAGSISASQFENMKKPLEKGRIDADAHLAGLRKDQQGLLARKQALIESGEEDTDEYKKIEAALNDNLGQRTYYKTLMDNYEAELKKMEQKVVGGTNSMVGGGTPRASSASGVTSSGASYTFTPK